MEIGEVVLFTGWRIDYPDQETWLTDEPVELISIDKLSEIGCYPNRYTIKFIDGEEQDCVRDCLRSAFNDQPPPRTTCPDCGNCGNPRTIEDGYVLECANCGDDEYEIATAAEAGP